MALSITKTLVPYRTSKASSYLYGNQPLSRYCEDTRTYPIWQHLNHSTPAILGLIMVPSDPGIPSHIEQLSNSVSSGKPSDLIQTP